MSNSIKNIIFDMGGVLVDFNPDKMIKRNIEPEYHSAVKNSIFLSEYWRLMDKGEISVDDALEKMLASLPEHIHQNVRSMVLEREREMPPIEQMTPIIKSLHSSSYRLFVLSNCPDWFHEFKRTIPCIELFEGFIVSADYHISKPDLGIYKILTDKYNLKAEECLFIDDSPQNTAAAESLGMKTVCFKNQDFDLLKSKLSEYGVKLQGA